MKQISPLTLIHGCLRAWDAEMRLAGLTVSMLFIRFFASAVTVSHSGEGYWTSDGFNSSRHIHPPSWSLKIKTKEDGNYIKSSCFDLSVEFVLIFIPERGITYQQDVEDNTCEKKI